ncbi:ribonuclease HII [Siculibacillus lacustris]|uniref:Ribonuclease HII n=1 Tax=Siculibacillus lacustris TaxID=1549641 RepID=A0A4Q9VCN1_9HYPH|nr:ribonuclease HII [Siculibacillus lacustris]TBW32316.1 ribonuclease HII [Siculibacillus lacustris]
MATDTTARPAKRLPRVLPDFTLERELGARTRRIAGVDEVGRGPLAGPVVCAAVVLDPTRLPVGLDDSKKLSEAARERFFEEILARHEVAVALSSTARIDATDIRQATLDAMRRAVAGLANPPEHVLVDGVDVPPGLICPGTAVIGGDGRSMSIAAASIVAKVIRDRLMVLAAVDHPGWGFERHKGYGTATHLEALERLGASPIHRRSFAPVAKAIARTGGL